MRTPIMPLYVGDLMMDTLELSAEAFGAYLRLLCKAWGNGAQPLPDDPALLARVTGLSEARWQEVRPHLLRYFDLSGGTWRQLRLEREWARVSGRRAKLAQASALGVKARIAQRKAGMRPSGRPNGQPMVARNRDLSAPASPPITVEPPAPACVVEPPKSTSPATSDEPPAAAVAPPSDPPFENPSGGPDDQPNGERSISISRVFKTGVSSAETSSLLSSPSSSSTTGVEAEGARAILLPLEPVVGARTEEVLKLLRVHGGTRILWGKYLATPGGIPHQDYLQLVAKLKELAPTDEEILAVAAWIKVGKGWHYKGNGTKERPGPITVQELIRGFAEALAAAGGDEVVEREENFEAQTDAWIQERKRRGRKG